MRNRYILLCLLLLPFLSKGQMLDDTSSVQFFVYIDPLTSIDTITQYLEDLNSTEIWKTSDNTLALWEVTGYPFTTPDGEQITNINSVIRSSKKKTKIQDATFNVLSTISNNDVPQVGSFDIQDYTVAQGSGRTVKVSILDTGIDPNISSSSTTELNYNLTTYSGYDYVNNDAIPEDQHGHGTHIAGIIHSITHGVSTTGDKIQFDIRKTHNSDGQGYISNIVIALFDAVKDADADIVNLSFGMSEEFDPEVFFPMRVAIQEAAEREAIVIAAAGNDNNDIDILTSTNLPAAFPEENILSIIALDSLDVLSTFSNFGLENTDVGVLGEYIPGPNLSGGISYRSGTSQATAIASGIAALVATHKSSMDPFVLKCSLMSSVAPVANLSGITASGGKLDISAAVNTHLSLVPTYNVTNLQLSGPGSLAHGLQGTCGVEQITFDPLVNGQVIPLELTKLNINSDIHFNGSGELNTIIELNNSTNIHINPTGELRLSNLTIRKMGTDPVIFNEGVLILSSKVKLE